MRSNRVIFGASLALLLISSLLFLGMPYVEHYGRIGAQNSWARMIGVAKEAF